MNKTSEPIKKNSKSTNNTTNTNSTTNKKQTKSNKNIQSETNETNENNETNTQKKSINEQLEYEYYNYVKEPLEKIIYMIDSQLNYLNIEDVFRSLKLIENLKNNISKSIDKLIEFDKILDDRNEKVERRKEVLFELNQLFIEHNKYNIAKKINERNQIELKKLDEKNISTGEIALEELNSKTTKTSKTKINKSRKSMKPKVELKIEEKIEPKVEEKIELKIEEKIEPKVEVKIEPNVEDKIEPKVKLVKQTKKNREKTLV